MKVDYASAGHFSPDTSFINKIWYLDRNTGQRISGTSTLKKFCTLALLYSASHFLSPHAAADNVNAPMILDPLSIQSVRVLLAPAGFYTRYAWREEDLERFVCARQTSNPAAISSFATVLANFSPAPFSLSISTLRGAVYIALADGGKIKLLMDDQGFKTDTRKVRVYDFPATKFLLLTGLEYQTLINWAKSTQNDAGYTERKDLTCAY